MVLFIHYENHNTNLGFGNKIQSGHLFCQLESHGRQVSVQCLELRNLTCLYFYFVRHPLLLLLFGASKISKLSLMLICICWHFLHLRKHDFLPNDLIEMTIILPNHYSRINIHPLPILVQEDDYIGGGGGVLR